MKNINRIVQIMICVAVCICSPFFFAYMLEAGGFYNLRPLSVLERRPRPFPGLVRPAQKKTGEYPPAVLKILKGDPAITAFTYDGTHLVARSGQNIFRRYELASGRRVGELDLSRVIMPDGRVVDISRRGQDAAMTGFWELQFSTTRLVISNVGTGNTETIVFNLCSVDNEGRFQFKTFEKGVSVVNVSGRFMTQSVSDAEGYPAALHVIYVSDPEDKFLKEYKTGLANRAVLLGDKVIFTVSKRTEEVEYDLGPLVGLFVADPLTGVAEESDTNVDMEGPHQPIVTTDDGVIVVAVQIPQGTYNGPNQWEARLFRFENGRLTPVEIDGNKMFGAPEDDRSLRSVRSVILTPTKYLAINRKLGDGDNGPSLSIFDKHTGQPAELPPALFDNLAKYRFEYFEISDDYLVICRSDDASLVAFSLATGEEQVLSATPSFYPRYNTYGKRPMALSGNELILYNRYDFDEEKSAIAVFDLSQGRPAVNVIATAVEYDSSGRESGCFLYLCTSQESLAFAHLPLAPYYDLTSFITDNGIRQNVEPVGLATLSSAELRVVAGFMTDNIELSLDVHPEDRWDAGSIRAMFKYFNDLINSNERFIQHHMQQYLERLDTYLAPIEERVSQTDKIELAKFKLRYYEGLGGIFKKIITAQKMRRDGVALGEARRYADAAIGEFSPAWRNDRGYDIAISGDRAVVRVAIDNSESDKQIGYDDGAGGIRYFVTAIVKIGAQRYGFMYNADRQFQGVCVLNPGQGDYSDPELLTKNPGIMGIINMALEKNSLYLTAELAPGEVSYVLSNDVSSPSNINAVFSVNYGDAGGRVFMRRDGKPLMDSIVTDADGDFTQVRGNVIAPAMLAFSAASGRRPTLASLTPALFMNRLNRKAGIQAFILDATPLGSLSGKAVSGVEGAI